MTAAKILAIALVPAALGVGALYWLSFGEGIHRFDRTIAEDNRSVAQEKRHNEVVHAVPLPVALINLTYRQNRAFEIRRMEINGNDLYIYIKNKTRICQDYVKLAWQQIAPDGTVIGSNETYLVAEQPGIQPGQSQEGHVVIEPDQRTVTIALSLTSSEYCNK